MIKKCGYCGEEFDARVRQKFCSNKCSCKFGYYKYREKRLEACKKYALKNFERDRKRRCNYIKKWYLKNKEKHNKNVLKDYYRNKKIWVERKFVWYHRKKILKLLPKECANCKLVGIKVIHHIIYDLPKRGSLVPKGKKKTKFQMSKYLKWYSKFLLGFCSKKCHKEYEKKNNKTKPLKI